MAQREIEVEDLKQEKGVMRGGLRRAEDEIVHLQHRLAVANGSLETLQVLEQHSAKSRVAGAHASLPSQILNVWQWSIECTEIHIDRSAAQLISIITRMANQICR